MLDQIDLIVPAGRFTFLLGRKLEIARALLHQPRLLLCDEATVGLDMPTRDALLADVGKLVRDDARTVLWATQLIEEVSPDDQVILLHRGKVLWQGVAIGPSMDSCRKTAPASSKTAIRVAF